MPDVLKTKSTPHGVPEPPKHTVTLYKRQRQIVEFISQFTQRNGYSPTLREIADAMGLSSLATVHEHIQRLVKKGVIGKTSANKTRGLVVINTNVGPEHHGVNVPILAFFSAGQELQQYNKRDAYIQVSASTLTGKSRSFALEMHDGTMVSEGILEGDYLIIEEDAKIHDGEVVIAILENGTATLKKIFKEETRVRLEPVYSAMPPIYSSRVQIQGKCRGVVRRYNKSSGKII
jgi:repressor LexA